MENSKFEQLFAALKPVIDQGRVDEYFSQKPIAELGMTEAQIIRILKYLNAHQFASICKNSFGFPLDYSPENLLYIDAVITVLCALDLDDTQISKLFVHDAHMNRDFDEGARRLLMAYVIKFRQNELADKKAAPDFSEAELLSFLSDDVVALLISHINDYMCETALLLFGGEYACDAIVNGHKDSLGVIIGGEYVSFIDAIYSRFFVEDLPLAYVFCTKFNLDYGAQTEILEDKYK